MSKKCKCGATIVEKNEIVQCASCEDLVDNTNKFTGKFYCQVKQNGLLRVTRHFSFGNVLIKRGFLTDGASVPYRVRGLTRITDLKYISCACVHDALYRIEGYDRKKADKMLDEMLKIQGMGRYERAKVYYLLRLFGSPTKDPKLLENAKHYVEIMDEEECNRFMKRFTEVK